MSKFKVGDRVRALANPTSRFYNNEGYFKAGEEFTVKDVLDHQGTVSLVERGQYWDESRFELVEEAKTFLPPNTSFKVGDKVRRKAGDMYHCDWCRGSQVLTVSEVDDLGGQQILRFAGVQHGWDGFRFELVEEAKPVAPVVPQLPGIPEGFRAVRIGTPAKGEWYVDEQGKARQSTGYYMIAKCYVILEKIEQPAPVEPAKPEAPAAPVKKAAPVFKKGDKIRCVTPVYCCTVGKTYEITEESCDLVFNDDDGDRRCRGFNMSPTEFELVTESPDDLVIQDRVPAREGIDFGWNVLIDEFDKFVPGADFWPIDWYYAGRKHGCVGGRSGHEACLRLAVMCCRKDLPITEKVRFLEYICWDNESPEARVLLWQTKGMVNHENYSPYDNEHPTGNTREVEVPIVKP